MSRTHSIGHGGTGSPWRTLVPFLAAVLVSAGASPVGGQTGPAPESPAPGASAAPADPLAPDTVLTPVGLPRVVVLDAPDSPIVTLRASVPFIESPTEGGAGRLLVALGVDRARASAGPVSARIDGTRTPTGIAYSVTGAVEDLDYLAYLLRVAMSEPRPGRIDFQRARNALVEELRRASETPSRRIARGLRERAFAGATPLDGTLGSLQAVTPATLRELWHRSHQRSRIDLIVVGDVPRELLLVSAQGMGAPDGDVGPAPDARAPRDPGGSTQVLRRWYGEARVLPDARDPRGAVAAFLVADHMRRVAGSFEAWVELWQLGDRQALGIMGAAYRAGASAMRSRVTAALRETADALDASALESAVARVRKDALLDARTPWGRAELVGRHLALTGDMDGARDWLAALDAIDVDTMKSYLADLAAATPVRTEVTP